MIVLSALLALDSPLSLQDGTALGDLAASFGYLTTPQGLAFLGTAYASNCQATTIPSSITAGSSITVEVAMNDSYHAPVSDDIFVSLKWRDFLEGIPTTFEIDVSDTCEFTSVGHVRCTFAPVASTVAYPKNSTLDLATATVDDFIITPELEGYFGPTFIGTISVETLTQFAAATVTVAVTSFKLPVQQNAVQYVYVAPSTASASFTVMTESSFSILPGGNGTADLWTFDIHANRLYEPTPLSTFTITLETQVNGSYHHQASEWVSADGQSFVRLRGADGGDFVLEGSFTQAGAQIVHVFLDDQEILNSPVTLLVFPGERE